MLLLSGIWMATGWNEGFTAVSGGAIMLFFGVNQDNPQAGARSYLVWSSIGMLVAYLAIVFLLPFLQGFEALAIVLLLLLLLPAGLMAGTPSYAWAASRWGAGRWRRLASAMFSDRTSLPISTTHSR
jgi:Fusaric acid resistance protein family